MHKRIFFNIHQGPTTALLGLMILIIPWLNSLAGLLVSGFVAGFMFAFADGAMQSLYLRIWGEERSRPFIQSFHFGISVGGLITPSIASPFLEMANSDQGTDPNCPDSSKLFQDYTGFTSSYHNISTTFLPPTDELNPVAWSYVIVGGFSLVASIPLFAFSFCGLDRKIKMRGASTKPDHKEEPLHDVWPILLLVFFFYFLNDMLEAIYTNYIYSISVCASGFTVTQAANLTSLFWFGNLVARFVAIVYSKYFQPRTIIIYDISLVLLSMIVICIFGEYINLVLWISTLSCGIGVATIYATGVTWASNVTDVSGSYMFVFLAGSNTSSMITLLIAGILFDVDPWNVMYLILSAALTIGFVFTGMEIAARRHESRIASVSENNQDYKVDVDYKVSITDNIQQTRL
ncbi:sodium-dependent glucose transporter 1C-like [Styela clava]